MHRRTFVKALGGGFAAAAGANFKMRADEADPYLSPEEDAEAVASHVRDVGDQLISEYPEAVGKVIKELVLRVRQLEDRRGMF